MTQIDYELNEPGTKTHVAEIVGLNKYGFRPIWFYLLSILSFYPRA